MKKKNCYTFATLFQKASRLDSLAQLVEHNTFNVGVLGSSPRRITEKRRGYFNEIASSFLRVGALGISPPVTYSNISPGASGV